MAGWNIRVIEHDEEKESYLALHEVYYDDVGNPKSWTEEPVSVMAEDGEGLEWYLSACQRATTEPVLRMSELLRNLEMKSQSN